MIVLVDGRCIGGCCVWWCGGGAAEGCGGGEGSGCICSGCGCGNGCIVDVVVYHRRVTG